MQTYLQARRLGVPPRGVPAVNRMSVVLGSLDQLRLPGMPEHGLGDERFASGDQLAALRLGKFSRLVGMANLVGPASCCYDIGVDER